MSVCKVCEEPLVLRLDPDEDADEAGPSGSSSVLETVPDDVEPRCGCHFHWQCLLDQSSDVAISLKCPSCNTYLPTNEAGPSTSNPFFPTPTGVAILVKYANEGGIQEDLDILPSITEEAYLEAHPEARPARALHVMCAEGDVAGIVELLRDIHDEVEDLGAFVRYQDPLAEMTSGLHLAIKNSQEETVWLLLWLAATIPDDGFPSPARHVAQSLGIGRLQVTVEGDIRGLRDGRGRSAADLAQEIQGPWVVLLEAGVLSI